MFSHRLEWSAPPNRLAPAIDRLRASGVPLLDLTESNPTLVGISPGDANLLAPLADPRAAFYQPYPAGLPHARQAVARYYQRRDLTIGEDQLLLTASTSEAYSFAFKLLADPGDEILVPQPSYPLFDYLAALDSVRATPYPLQYQEGWWIEPEALARRITPRTRAIVVVNPNNPTGSYLHLEERDRLADLALRHGLVLIADEVFLDYRLEDSAYPPQSLLHLAGVPTLVLSGLSKLAGLPQMKLAWIVVNGPGPWRQAALRGLELIADSYLSVNTPVQWAAGCWLDACDRFQSSLRARLRENLRLLQASARPLVVEGGWYAVVPLAPGRSEEDALLWLANERHVILQPGYFFDFSTSPFAVLSLLPHPETFREGLARAAPLWNETNP